LRKLRTSDHNKGRGGQEEKSARTKEWQERRKPKIKGTREKEGKPQRGKYGIVCAGQG